VGITENKMQEKKKVIFHLNLLPHQLRGGEYQWLFD
jgi:hypothetical protein